MNVISLNAICAKFLQSALYVKKEKDVIYAKKLKNVMKTIPNNVFVILIIFKNDTVNVQLNSTTYVAKTLVLKNHVLNMKKYHPCVYQKVNNLRLTLFKIIPIFL